MSNSGIGVYPGGTNPAFIHLTGTIVSWWARIEGIMVQDIWALRTQPANARIVEKEQFPTSAKNIAKHWRKLLINGYGAGASEASKIDDAVRRAIELIEHRNHLVHSFWPYGQIEHEKLELSWIRPDPKEKYGVRRGTYSMTVDELDKINQRFANLYVAVMAISFNSHRIYRELGGKGAER